jgi:hypothetical protein
MLPPRCRNLDQNQQAAQSATILRLELADNLTITVVTGTYGDSLDPNFDCGGGPPDMVIGMNAGL